MGQGWNKGYVLQARMGCEVSTDSWGSQKLSERPMTRNHPWLGSQVAGVLVGGL